MGWGHFLLGAMTHKWMSDGDEARRREAERSEREWQEIRESMTPEERAHADAIYGWDVAAGAVLFILFIAVIWFLVS